MNLSAIFVRRPIATTLLALGAIFAGVFAYQQLPVSALPQVEYPTITVTADLPGASPDTVATSVATPLIKALETIPSLNTISAHSTAGTTDITLQFDPSRSIDAAAGDVQSALAGVVRRLPTGTSAPSYRKANPASAPILLIALQSPSLSVTELGGLAQNVIAPRLSSIPGVAQAQISAAKTYAVRIEVDPSKLAARNLTMDQIATAVSQANSQTPLGSVNKKNQSLLINASTQLATLDQFSSLVVATINGNPIHLADIAKAIDSVDNTQTSSTYDGKPAMVVAIARQPDANTVAVVDAIKATLPELQAQLPGSVSINLMNDGSTSIRAAVGDVQFSLMVTLGLVVLVIYLFLGGAYTTLVPALAIPLSVIGTFGGMYLLGFSIDNISLLGLTLSVGLVVDDAIVVIENIIRHVEEGKPPLQAALVGSREVAGTIVSMSLSLIAVFIPILLMGGVVGRLFHEFGLVVSLAIAISALVSLTVTPMMAAKLPRSSVNPPAPLSPPGLFDRAFQRVLVGYNRSVAWCLAHPVLIMLAFVGTIATSGVLSVLIPSTFLPQEDIGQLQINVLARQDISYPLMASLEERAAAVVRASPSVDHVASTVANDTLNTGQMFVQLKPKNARPPLPQVMSQLRTALAKVPGITSTMKPIQSLRISGGGSGSYQLVVQSLDPTILPLWSAKIAQAMAADPQTFIEVTPDPQNTALQLGVVVNRDAANALGVSADAIRAAIQSGFGSRIVGTLQTAGNSTNIYLEFDPTLPGADRLVSTITVRSNSGVSVPLSSVASVTRVSGPMFVNQTGQLVSTNISFNLPNGVGLGNAISQIAQIKQNIGLPASVFTMYTGTAALFTQTMASQGILIVAAIVTIYIVLGVLYESFIHPITILSGLPAAATGALLALMITGQQLSVIAIIGIFMLIGIVKKNAIMMVDVALSLKRTDGLNAAEAIRLAAVRRFRPIMMTTLCAIFGALPIALGNGPSSELRQPLGIAVVGGLLLSQILTLFITPVIFVQLDRLGGVATSIRGRFASRALPVSVPAE